MANKKQKNPGGRKPLPEGKKRIQLSITLPPHLYGLMERERMAATMKPTISQMIEAALTERYRTFGWLPKL